MVWKEKVSMLLLAITVLFLPNLIAQDDEQENPISIEREQDYRSGFSEESWQDLIKDLDYATEEMVENNQVRPPQERETGLNANPMLQALFFIVVIAILVLIILKLFGHSFFLPNKKNKEKHWSELKNLNENIHVADLDHLLMKALDEKNFKLAIRIYYLIIIKELSLRDMILWKKDKTNREYLREMQMNEHYSIFRKATNTFERVWYGERIIDEEDYQKINPVFKELIKRIGKN